MRTALLALLLLLVPSMALAQSTIPRVWKHQVLKDGSHVVMECWGPELKRCRPNDPDEPNYLRWKKSHAPEVLPYEGSRYEASDKAQVARCSPAAIEVAAMRGARELLLESLEFREDGQTALAAAKRAQWIARRDELRSQWQATCASWGVEVRP